jgi:hypothetical protein
MSGRRRPAAVAVAVAVAFAASARVVGERPALADGMHDVHGEVPGEVVVRAAPRDPGASSVTTEEVRKVPGAFGDPFRVVGALPGAVPFESDAPYPIIRGAPPGNSLTVIDGVPVPLLYHLGFGPAVVHPDMLAKVDYFPGGAPARFGRVVGGVISADLRPVATEGHVHALVRLFDAGALVESPFGGDGTPRADALVAGRYSYTGAILTLTSPHSEIGYWDYQARAGVEVADGERLSVFAFGSHDHRTAIGYLKTTFDSDFHRVDVRWDHALGGGDGARIAVTGGDDRSGNEQGSAAGRNVRVRAELAKRLANLQLRAGADATLAHVDPPMPVDPRRLPVFQALYPTRDDLTTGVHGDLAWQPAPRVTLVPGARVDLYESRFHDPSRTSAALAVDPRLAARVELRRGLFAHGTVGIYHQGPSFFVPVPGLSPAASPGELQESLQRGVGVEVALPWDVSLDTTAFWHEYANVTSFSLCAIEPGGFDTSQSCIDKRADGRSVGVEILARRALTKRLGGWIAYTLSRSVERRLAVDSSALAVGSSLVSTAYDHTHVVNVVASYDFGRRWTAGARLFAYTGSPTDYTAAGVVTARIEPFVRLDVRLEKRWPFRSGWWAFIAEVQNVTFSRELSESPSSCASPPCYLPPVVFPSIGVEASL